MKKITYIIIVFCVFVSNAQNQIPGEKQNESTLFQNAKIVTVTGEIIEKGHLGISQGIIDYIGISAPEKQYTNKINLNGKHIYPGFIALNSTLGLVEVDAVRASDDESEIGIFNPNIRSIIAYNAESKIVETMRMNGVLLAQVTPRGGVVSGSSSVVQLDAWNWEDAAIKTDEGIHVNWPSAYSRGSRWAPGPRTLSPSTTYLSNVERIKSVFHNAKNYLNDTNKEDLRLRSMQGLFNGSQTLYLHLNNKRQIQDALSFFKSLGIEKVVLVGAREAHLIPEFLKEHSILVVAAHPHRLPSSEDADVKEAFNLGKKLDEAGVVFGIDVRGQMERMNTRNLPFYAGSFVGHGLNYNTAVKSLTINAAKILGIDDKYGSLEVGKSATFFVSEGDALDMRTNIVHSAYIDGRELELVTHQTKLRDKYLEKVERNN